MSMTGSKPPRGSNVQVTGIETGDRFTHTLDRFWVLALVGLRSQTWLRQINDSGAVETHVLNHRDVHGDSP